MLEGSQTNPHSDLPVGGISTEIQTAPGDDVVSRSETETQRPLPFGVYRGDLKPVASATEPEATVAPQ